MQRFGIQGVLQRVVAGLLRLFLRLLLKPVFSPRVPIARQRRWLAALARVTLAPRAATFEQAEVAGVPGEWVRCRRRPDGEPGIWLYLHGGAYCIGSAATHRALTGRLALASGRPVFAADYRLAPEHPHPAALDDALAAFRALARSGPVVIAGDSAGGGLALATALALREAGGPQPAGLVLLSPWADLVTPDPPPPEPPGEAMLSVAWAQACAAHYLNGAEATCPLASPLRARLEGLPPVLIQVGTDELLYPQAVDLHRALTDAGVEVRGEVTAGAWHVFQLHGGVLRAADEAIARIVDFASAQFSRAVPAARRECETVILGAGMSGLCAGIRLHQAGRHDFVILEKQPGLGGTWWDNRYPGAHVDVPAPLYSFSFAPNPRWSRRFASAPEIQAYMAALSQRHGLPGRIRLGTRITRAVFDEARGRWDIDTDRGDRFSARWFICSTGPLNQPRWPDIPGLDGFRGRRLHSARWDPSVDLAGLRVGVIGTGSTASQLVGPIAQTAGQLHVFQRTANWVLPRLDRRYNALDHLLARFPPYARAVRWLWMQVLEWGRRGFDEGTVARRGMLRTAAAHRARQLRDPALREAFTPPYPLGCKRIIYSNDFYPAFNQSNVELVTGTIARITEGGIETADGRHRPLDVLVCATGFDTVHLLASVEIVGRGGLHLREAWAEGPQAWNGLSVAGFPNLFLMLGPNTATGHTSTLLYIEPGMQHVLDAMARADAGGHRSLEITAQAQAAYNTALQQRLGGSVWSQCRSWYRMEGGRIVALWPGFTAEYVRRVRSPDWADYRFD